MRRPLLLIVIGLMAFGALAALAGPGRAADEPAHGKAEAAAHGDGHGDAHGGHGKKDEGVFGQALDLAIWTVLVFLILLAVLGKFAWGPMMEGLKRREESIRAAIDDAAKAREEAQKMRQELQAEIAKAHEEQRKIVDEAHKSAQRLAEEMKAEAQAQIAAERERLRKEIHTATDQALQQIWQQAAHLATEVSSKAIRRSLSEDDHRRLVDDALQELKTAAANGHKG